jgi:hypothetical protein
LIDSWIEAFDMQLSEDAKRTHDALAGEYQENSR